MEIEIVTKKNNPLLNRTEVRFNINHKNEKTPNRNIIRTELAEVLNANKENIIIDKIETTFGLQKCTGYAKIYSSIKRTENIEKKYILKRNKIIEKKSKKDEKTDDKKEKKEEITTEEKPLEKSEKSTEKEPEKNSDESLEKKE